MRILSWNINDSNPRKPNPNIDVIIRIIEEQKVDFLCLQECSDDTIAKLENKGFVTIAKSKCHDDQLVILSRSNFVLDSQAYDEDFVELTTEHLRIINCHMSVFCNTDDRKKKLRKLGLGNDPTILIGDTGMDCDGPLNVILKKNVEPYIDLGKTASLNTFKEIFENKIFEERRDRAYTNIRDHEIHFEVLVCEFYSNHLPLLVWW